GDIQPEYENDDRSQRTIGGAVAVEKMQIEAEPERRNQPQRNPSDGSWRDPVPLSLLQIGTEVVDNGERQEHGRERERPLQHLPPDSEHVAQPDLRSQ